MKRSPDWKAIYSNQSSDSLNVFLPGRALRNARQARNKEPTLLCQMKRRPSETCIDPTPGRQFDGLTAIGMRFSKLSVTTCERAEKRCFISRSLWASSAAACSRYHLVLVAYLLPHFQPRPLESITPPARLSNPSINGSHSDLLQHNNNNNYKHFCKSSLGSWRKKETIAQQWPPEVSQPSGFDGDLLQSLILPLAESQTHQSVGRTDCSDDLIIIIVAVAAVVVVVIFLLSPALSFLAGHHQWKARFRVRLQGRKTSTPLRDLTCETESSPNEHTTTGERQPQKPNESSKKSAEEKKFIIVIVVVVAVELTCRRKRSLCERACVREDLVCCFA